MLSVARRRAGQELTIIAERFGGQLRNHGDSFTIDCQWPLFACHAFCRTPEQSFKCSLATLDNASCQQPGKRWILDVDRSWHCYGRPPALGRLKKNDKALYQGKDLWGHLQRQIYEITSGFFTPPLSFSMTKSKNLVISLINEAFLITMAEKFFFTISPLVWLFNCFDELSSMEKWRVQVFSVLPLPCSFVVIIRSGDVSI